MSTVTPPTPPTPSAPPAVSATATVIKAPAAVKNMHPGQTLQATQKPDVTSQLPPRQVQVQTPIGPMTLQTALQIPKGATLTMILVQLEPKPQFLITEINGKPVPQAQQAAQQILPQPQTVLPPVKTVPALPIQDGARMAATLLRPSTPATTQRVQPQAQTAPQSGSAPQTAPAAQPAPAGTSAPTPAVPTPTPAQSTPATPVTQPSTQAPQSSQPTHTQAQVQPAQLPVGAKFQISVVRVDTPQIAANTTTQPTPGGLSQGATLSGIVTGTTPKGQPIVQGPNATFTLDTSTKIAEGSRVVVKVETAPSLPTVKAAQHMSEAGAKEALIQSKSWGTLDEALKAIATLDPARFQHIQQHIMPQPGGKLTNQMLFFMNALKGGDLKAWMGDGATRVLENERPAMLNRLNTDFQAMARLVDEPQQNDWRLALIPLMSDGVLEQIRMYYRNRGGQDAEHNEAEGTRFVLDLDLSNMGHVQIDGLMKTDDKKLDLIIRTEHPLPAPMRTDMGDIFLAAQDYIGIVGSLAFQAAPGNFIEFASPENVASEAPGLFA